MPSSRSRSRLRESSAGPATWHSDGEAAELLDAAGAVATAPSERHPAQSPNGKPATGAADGPSPAAVDSVPDPAATATDPSLGDDLGRLWYRHRGVRVAAVLVALVLVGVAAWLFLHRSDPDASSGDLRVGAGPVASSQAELVSISRELGVAIYWAGEIPDTTIEATLTTGRAAYVRYLAPEARVGDPAAEYLVVGTYPDPNALANLRAYARRKHAETERVSGGGLAVVVPSSPTSVFVAYPGADAQVEVYDPEPGRALSLIDSGEIRPVDTAIGGGFQGER